MNAVNTLKKLGVEQRVGTYRRIRRYAQNWKPVAEELWKENRAAKEGRA